MGVYSHQALKNFNANSPVSAVALREFEAQSAFRLPGDYIVFLKQSNGGEGFVGENSYPMS